MVVEAEQDPAKANPIRICVKSKKIHCTKNRIIKKKKENKDMVKVGIIGAGRIGKVHVESNLYPGSKRRSENSGQTRL